MRYLVEHRYVPTDKGLILTHITCTGEPHYTDCNGRKYYMKPNGQVVRLG